MDAKAASAITLGLVALSGVHATEVKLGDTLAVFGLGTIGLDVYKRQDYQPEMSDSIKVALMGPLAGIGDTVQGVLVQPITYILAASLAQEGSILAVPMIIIPLLILFLLRWPLFKWGYNRSVKILEDMSGESDFNTLREAAQDVYKRQPQHARRSPGCAGHPWGIWQ